MRTSEVRHHDANFVGLRCGSEDTVTLYFVSEDGVEFDTTLYGVRRLRCDDFRKGNIVFDLERVGAANVDKSEIEFLFDLNERENPDLVREVLLKLENEQFVFVRLTSSYGASLCALCESMQSSRRQIGPT